MTDYVVAWSVFCLSVWTLRWVVGSCALAVAGGCGSFGYSLNHVFSLSLWRIGAKMGILKFRVG